MDLKDYLDLFGEWLWLILIVALVSGAIGYMVTPRLYEARVLISVGGYIQSPDPERVDVATAMELAQAYEIVAKTRSVLQGAADSVDMPLSVSEMQALVETRVLPDTAILEVRVTYSDPVLATDLAYAIADELVYLSPTDLRLSASTSRGLPANYLTIIEGARPTRTGPGPLSVAVLGALIGVSLACGGVLLKDYLSDAIVSADEALAVLGLPILGTIPGFPRGQGSAEGEVWGDRGGDLVSERYRALRTTFLHSISQQEMQPYMVTSAGVGEGKSVTAANLAAAIALTDLNVLLIDADFRRPRIHELFGSGKDKGFATLLATESPSLDERCELLDIADIVAEVVQETDIPGLRVITSGRILAESPALLATSNTQRWMTTLQSATDVDVILVDTPPALVVSDAFDLGMRTEAAVVLVLEAKKTTRTAALEVKRQCELLNLRMHGVILNHVKDSVQIKNYKEKRMAYREELAKATETPTALPAKILVVEDDPSLAKLMTTQLSKIGYKVEVADNRRRALEIFPRWKPDLVILDVMLTDEMDGGFEVSKRIRQMRKLATVPIIMVTGRVDYDARVTGFEAGADDYITKPFELDDLALRVAALLRRANVGNTRQWSSLPSQPYAAPGASVDGNGSARTDG